MTRGPREMLGGPKDGALSGPGRRRWPVVCTSIILGSVVMFFADSSLMQAVRVPGQGMGFLKPLALYGPLVQQGQYWRMLGFAFEHGGPLHLLFNMSVVYTLGFTLERALGAWRFLLVSIVTCVGSAAFALYFGFQQPTVGASGMILGWAGVMLPASTATGRRELGVWLVQVALLSLLPGISWAGHLGGFAFGLPCGLALKQGRAFFARAAPVLLFLTAVIAVLAAHPELR